MGFLSSVLLSANLFIHSIQPNPNPQPLNQFTICAIVVVMVSGGLAFLAYINSERFSSIVRNIYSLFVAAFQHKHTHTNSIPFFLLISWEMEKNFDIDIVCMSMKGVVLRLKMFAGYFFSTPLFCQCTLKVFPM